MLFKKMFYLLILNIVLIVSICEARGGSRGRGGSFGGGLFGGWRKYKKPVTNNGRTRRIVSSSPMHTVLTKSLAEQRKSNAYHGNLPKKAKLYKQNELRRYHIPPGGSYYRSMDVIPSNAVFISEVSDTLATYLGFTLGWKSTYHPHQNVQEQYLKNGDRINSFASLKDGKINETSFITYNKRNESIVTNNKVAEFIRAYNATTNPIEDTANDSTVTNKATNRANDSPAPWGVICLPLTITEKNYKKSEELQELEILICYAAPPPPPIDVNKNDFSSYHLMRLLGVTTSSTPVQIAGDIEE
uniref:Uncharacterized protein n=1 Tax=Glossina brevipalpis TaxID=37001 RepID=A0A1A9WZJ5_9MUSC